jgi:hypothetical protein
MPLQTLVATIDLSLHWSSIVRSERPSVLCTTRWTDCRHCIISANGLVASLSSIRTRSSVTRKNRHEISFRWQGSNLLSAETGCDNLLPSIPLRVWMMIYIRLGQWKVSFCHSFTAWKPTIFAIECNRHDDNYDRTK